MINCFQFCFNFAVNFNLRRFNQRRQPVRQRVIRRAQPRPQRLGRAVQVDPIKPMLKAPRIKRLKLIRDEPLSNFAFKFNLRRYDSGGEYNSADSAALHTLEAAGGSGGGFGSFASISPRAAAMPPAATGQGLTLVHFSAHRKRFLWDRGRI